MLDGVSGKEVARESGDDVFQQGKRLAGGRRNPHQPLQDRRHLDDREAGVSRILSAAPALLPQEHRDVDRLVPQMWEGMSWVDGQRSERREDVLGEVSARCRPLLRVERIGRDEVQSVPLQARENVGRPDPMLLFHHGVNVRADRRELLVRQEAVGSRLAHTPELLLLESRDAHHEEFVEIRGNDGQELEPLEDRQRDIRRLFEHPRVELEPRQLAVEEQLRVVELGNPPRPLLRGGCRFALGRRRRRLHRRLHSTHLPCVVQYTRGVRIPEQRHAVCDNRVTEIGWRVGARSS